MPIKSPKDTRGVTLGRLRLGGMDDLEDLGYQVNESTRWQQTGIYGLALEQSLFGPNDTGLYGIDTVSFGGDAAWN